MTTKKATKAKPYLVTTAHRGVFFGWASPDSIDGNTITLSKCRNCVYWSADCQGFVGLATKGPTTACKIGPAAEELQLRAITSVVLCTDAAASVWDSALWK